MTRDTIYTFYSTGRSDPTYTNIWAFQNAIERSSFFIGKPHLQFTKQKYWRTGATVKIPIKYETALQYDYAIIDNDSTDAQNARRWYCFIDAKAYVSPNVTLVTLSVDWVQTYYFLSGGVPFWQYSGFITRATNHSLPPDGTPSDYPVPQASCVSFTQETGGYALVMYASVSPASAIAGDLEYTSATVDGVPMSSPPYILKGSTTANLIQTLVQTINGYNTNGMTDTITGIYLVPDTYLPSNIATNVWVNGWSFTPPTRTITIEKPGSSVEYADILTLYGYTNLIINNGQGETENYNFNEFNGDPQFQLCASFAGGSPTLFCKPLNLKYNNGDANERIIKITQAPAIGWLNDSYKIWLAQTQNSRAASIAGAELAISQAEEARDKSWAYQNGKFIRDIEWSAKGDITSGAANLIGGVAGVFGTDLTDIPRSTGIKFKDTTIPYSDKSVTVAQRHGYSDYGGVEKNLGYLYDIGMAYVNHQLGIETIYTYDHAVANAQQSLNQLLASYSDKSRIPATARGSNAYGDMARFHQYGFMFAVFAPSADSMSLLNNMVAAGGHTVNRYQPIVKIHAVFDYFQANSVKIPANPALLPQFVRKMMLGLLQSGVYLWYYNNGDISQYIGSPYGIDNEYLER